MMTESRTSQKPVRTNRRIFIGVVAVMLLAMFLFLVYSFRKDPYRFVMFFYSLTQRIDIGDAGVLSGEPCAVPCVLGIQAGVTHFDEVPSFLKKHGVTKCMTEPSVSWVAISCGAARFNVQASTHTSLVTGIWFYPNDSISIGQMIGNYGEPDYVSLSTAGLPDAPTIKTYIYWDSLRMSVVLPEIGGRHYVIDKTTDIEIIGVSDEDVYQDSSEVEFGGYYQPWKGYGTYQPPFETIPSIPMPTATMIP